MSFAALLNARQIAYWGQFENVATEELRQLEPKLKQVVESLTWRPKQSEIEERERLCNCGVFRAAAATRERERERAKRTNAYLTLAGLTVAPASLARHR